MIGHVKNENLKHRFGYESELIKKQKCVILKESTFIEGESGTRKLLTFRFYAWVTNNKYNLANLWAISCK